MQELDVVALTVDIPEQNLKAGNSGTILEIFGDPPVYLVEFLDKSPVPIAIAFVQESQVRLVHASSQPLADTATAKSA